MNHYSQHPKTLDDYLALNYTFCAVADPSGGWVIKFPDLPGCLGQVDAIEDVGWAAQDIFETWMSAAHEAWICGVGPGIPLPTYQEG